MDELHMAIRYTLSVFDILTPDQQQELIEELKKRAVPVSDRHETD